MSGIGSAQACWCCKAVLRNEAGVNGSRGHTLLLAGVSHEGLSLVSPSQARGQQEQSSSLGSLRQWLVTEAWQLLPRAGTLLLGAGVPCRSLHRQDAPYCNEVV